MSRASRPCSSRRRSRTGATSRPQKVRAAINRSAIPVGIPGRGFLYGAGLVQVPTTFECGDGDLDASEQCDNGPSNGASGSCCSAACFVQAPDAVCRAASGACDVAELCDGISPQCPGDTLAVIDSPCESDGNTCTLDVCGGGGQCLHSPGNEGEICRDSLGPCDLEERCDGSSAGRPPDEVQPQGTACTDDGSTCTADLCDANGFCTHAAAHDGASCSDGDACTVNDSCLGGVCDAGPLEPNACADPLLCYRAKETRGSQPFEAVSGLPFSDAFEATHSDVNDVASLCLPSDVGTGRAKRCGFMKGFGSPRALESLRTDASSRFV